MNYYEKISEIIGEVNSHIESKKHAVVDHNFWEKKALAYPVKKHKYGNYILLNTEFKNSDFVNEFKVFLNLHAEVLKYIIIKLDGKPEAPVVEDATNEVEDKKEEEK